MTEFLLILAVAGFTFSIGYSMGYEDGKAGR